MGTGKDVKKRKRRPMTTEEHAARGKKNHGTTVMLKSVVPLPPLPFKSKEENIQFAKCALDDDFPFKDDEQAAIQWCNYVDGVSIHAKLPFHMRHQRETSESET